MLYRLENLRFSYGSQKVLNIDHLQLANGRVYAIVGQNGAGKTTLLKILSGLLTIESGEIYFQDKLIDKKNHRILGNETIYVHQNPMLLKGTVFDNVAYGLQIRKFAKREIKLITNNFLEMLGLSSLTVRNSKNLSQGEIKRVAIARALALTPKVLLLDEPTGHIDKESATKIKEVLLKINKDLGTTIIYSSHDNKFNEQLADKVFLLANGELQS
jgi:tungstate transport system ATP-binding protein